MEKPILPAADSSSDASEPTSKLIGRPRYLATEERETQLYHMAKLGIPFAKIAKILTIDVKTLRRRLGRILDEASLEAPETETPGSEPNTKRQASLEDFTVYDNDGEPNAGE